MARKLKLHKKEKESIDDLEVYKKKATKLLKEHGIYLIILFIILAIIPLYFFVIKPNKEKKNLKASDEMFRANYYFEEGNYDKALKGDGSYKGFTEIINTYPNTKAAQLANFYIGIINMNKKEYESAISNFKKFNLKDYLLQARAYSLIGDAFSQQGKFKEALDYYMKAANEKPNKILSPKYLSKAAIVNLKLGNKKAAMECYKDIKKQYPKSIYAKEADKKIYALQ
ncbi:MAG: tetratricopeptide repeat protein [Bacteroidetes bacterium]|nr:tetratricopeptide repeat protein [Bacteroidota bacterium]